MSERIGLCASCVHARVVESAKGSRFWLCQLSETDARFRKYPPLPVLACAGYEHRGLPRTPQELTNHDDCSFE